MLRRWMEHLQGIGIDIEFDEGLTTGERLAMASSGEVDVLFACGLLTMELIALGTPLDVVKRILKMNSSNKIIIAIDGYSSTGKSTLAKHMAKEIGYVYVDTGAMYRAVAYYAMTQGLIDDNHFDKNGLILDLNNIDLNFEFNAELGYAEIFLNGNNVERFIRSIEVSNMVSKVASISEIREKLVEQQQKMSLNKGIVMDGRDIGTVVFPEAELKLFMTASPEKRAQRRYKEMTDNGVQIQYESVLENVTSRDHLDTTRADSPLVKAGDAIEIDNSDMNVAQTYALAMKYVNEKIEK